MHWQIGTYDNHDSIRILKKPASKEEFRFREEYRDIACGTCGRIDELAALRRGIHHDVELPKKTTDFVRSNDHWYLISAKARDVLLQLKGVQAEFLEIPSSPSHFVVIPKKLIYPPPRTKFYGSNPFPKQGDVFQMRRRPCKGCGRPVIGWRNDWFDAPAATVFSGVVLEIEGGMSIPIIMNDDVVSALKAAKLTGWRKHALKS